LRFEWPLALLALLVVPAALAAYLIALRRPSRYALSFPNLGVLETVVDRSGAWRRWVPPALFLLALTAMALALGRPHVNVTVEREQATVVLAIDVSRSMVAEDVAQVVAPATDDRDLVRQSLDFLVPERGTAIGDAVAQAAEVARSAVDPDARTIAYVTAAAPSGDDDAPPAAILFLSDGFQTSGILAPLDGAERAKELGIPVYTIALGTDAGVVEFGFGGEQRTIPVPPDRATLRAIAQATGGKYFDAPSAEALTAAYAELGSLLSGEPGEMEATFAFLAAAAALGLLAAALGALWFARIP
jgi:Ca-activated chloride channel family protein